MNYELSKSGWNIANQYEIPNLLTAEFLSSTFSAWFKNTEVPTLAKNIRKTQGRHNIEIDTNCLIESRHLEKRQTAFQSKAA